MSAQNELQQLCVGRRTVSAPGLWTWCIPLEFSFSEQEASGQLFFCWNFSDVCDKVWQIEEWSHFFAKNSYSTCISPLSSKIWWHKTERKNSEVKTWFLFLASEYIMGKTWRFSDRNLSRCLLLKLCGRPFQEFEEILFQLFREKNLTLLFHLQNS